MNIKSIWYSPKIDINSPEGVHQILMFGNLKEIKSLKKTVGQDKVKELFLSSPKKVYTSSALNFIKNFILSINTPIDEQKYLKTASRAVR